MKDRIAKAHELRATIHAWMKENQGCEIRDCCNALKTIQLETIRKAIRKMAENGYCYSTGTYNDTRWHAVGTYPLEDEDKKTRSKLATGNGSPPGRYEKTAAVRQSALDYLHQNPGSSAAQVAAAIKQTRGTTGNALRSMSDMGEVRKTGNVYTAIATQTISADEQREKAGNKMGYGQHNKNQADFGRREVTVVVGAKTIHRGMERDRPLQNQGGQGALRRQVGIQSTAELV